MSRTAGWRAMFAAERLKMKGSLALALAVAAPAAPAFLSLLVGLRNGHQLPAGVNPWNSTASSAWEIWGLLMLPFLVALQVALMAHLESANSQWKHLQALPISRARLYLVKLGVAAMLLALSTLMLLVYLLLSGALLGLVKPEIGLLRMAPEWGRFFGMALRPLLAVVFLLAIHQWISSRWSSLPVAMGIGVAGVSGVLIVTNSPLGGRLFPWSLPFRALQAGAPDLTFILVYAAAGCLAVTMLGAWEASRRELE